MGLTRTGPLLMTAALCAVVACSGAPRDGSDPFANELGADSSAQLACDEFRSAMSDVQDGLMTEAEFRSAIKRVYDDYARVSENEGIPAKGQALLREVTTGTTDGFVRAAERFATACEDLGL